MASSISSPIEILSGIIKAAGHADDTDPTQIRYILDKSFLNGWIENSTDTEDNFIKSVMDLFLFLRYRRPVNIVIPVDVLIEMEKEGKRWVSNESFLKLLNALALIKEVNPEIELTAKDAIIKITEKYKEQGIPCVILTRNKIDYSSLDGGITKVTMASEILIAAILMYKVMPQEVKNVYDSWLKVKKEENKSPAI